MVLIRMRRERAGVQCASVRILDVRRFALAIVIACLTFSVAGLSALVVPEPCTSYEQSQRTDAACPPTCVTCGCCAQAVEPVTLHVAGTLEAHESRALPPLPRALNTRARDVFHVPKPLLG